MVGLQHRGGVRGGARVRAEQREDQLLLAPAAVELGVGLGLQDRRRAPTPPRGRAAVLVADRRVLDQPQEAEPAPAAQDRDADARLHPDRGMRRDPDGLGGVADAVAEERVARRVGRRAAEDARGADRVQLPELDAVGERAQVDVVDQHRAPEAHAELVDDLLEVPVTRPQPMPHRVLGDDARLDELQQVVRAAGLRAGAGQAVAAERLARDHRARDVAVDVEVADRQPAADALDDAGVAAEEAAGERERLAARRSRTPRRSSRTRSTASSGPKISSSATRDPGGSPSTTAGATKWPCSGASPGWWTRAPSAARAAGSARPARATPRSITGGTSTPKRCAWSTSSASTAPCRRSSSVSAIRSCTSSAAGGRALLAREAERGVGERGDGVVEVGVGVDDHAVLAAHLGHDALEVALAGGQLRSACAGSPGRPRRTR